MHFDSFFRQFFGPSFLEKRPSEEEEHKEDSYTSENNQMFSGPQWNGQFEQLDQMMIKLLQESFANISLLSETPIHQERTTNPIYTGVSLRDQMLKPGFTDQLSKGEGKSDRNIKTNLHLDETGKNDGNLSLLLPKPRDDGMHYSARSSTNYFRSLNGATESKSVVKDRDGCHRELITKEFNGKKYVMESKQCPGAPPQTTETLINMSGEDLPEFLKIWGGQS